MSGLKISALVFCCVSLVACGSGGGGDTTPAAVSVLEASTAVKQQALPIGSIACPNGGIQLQIGIDQNGNGSLDVSEVNRTENVCNGENGVNGSPGLTALVLTSTEAAGANCSNGGKKVQFGLDANVNGILDASEVTDTSYVCNGSDGMNGVDGLNALFVSSPEAAGTNCTNGGIHIDTGVDNNSNGILDASEITSTSYVCNGLDGNLGDYSSLLNISSEPIGQNCQYGGKKIESGIDVNGDGILNLDEVDSTQFICSDKISFPDNTTLAEYSFESLLNDLTGHGFDLMNSSPVYIDSTYGKAIDVGSSGDVGYFFDNTIKSEKFGFSFLVKSGFFFKLSERTAIYQDQYDGKIYVWVFLGGDAYSTGGTIVSQNPVDLSSEKYIVVNFDNSIGSLEKIKVYVNGAQIPLTGTFTLFDGAKFDLDYFLMLSKYSTPSSWTVDELKIKNSIFTDSEISQLYNLYFPVL